ncbi:MAG: hypothetical protein ACR2ND_07225 [Solirubrobacteraceae bacterium]
MLLNIITQARSSVLGASFAAPHRVPAAVIASTVALLATAGSGRGVRRQPDPAEQPDLGPVRDRQAIRHAGRLVLHPENDLRCRGPAENESTRAAIFEDNAKRILGPKPVVLPATGQTEFA